MYVLMGYAESDDRELYYTQNEVWLRSGEIEPPNGLLEFEREEDAENKKFELGVFGIRVIKAGV